MFGKKPTGWDITTEKFRKRDSVDIVLSDDALTDDLTSVRIDKIERKLKWWQALALAALTGAATSIYGVASGLYTRGEKEGINEMRLRQCEQRVTRNEDLLEKLRSDIFISRFNHLVDSSPIPILPGKTNE